MLSSQFQIGRCLATPGALETLGRCGVSALTLLRRHIAGDWGDLDDEDKAANNRAISDGSRLLSAYSLNDNSRVWIITEAVDDEGNRSATTLLLPAEY